MPKVEKTQFRNESGGWVGVIVIGPRGDDNGIPVEPGATVWLSEEEQILTANAPRDPEDNPFTPSVVLVTNAETGEIEEVEVTHLVAVDEARYVPANVRPIPADIDAAGGSHQAAAAGLAALGDSPELVTAPAKDAETRHEEVAAAGDQAQPVPAGLTPPVPPRAAEAAQAAQEPPTPPEEAAPAPVGPPPPAAPPVPPQAPAPDPSFPSVPEEEVAAKSPGPGSEETGAALPPSGPAPEGEFAKAEEVGTPVEPQSATPPPFSPQE